MTTNLNADQDKAILAMPDVDIDEAIHLSSLSDRELLYHVVNAVALLCNSHDEIKTLTREIVEQVQPVIEQVSNGPVGKLLGMGK